jgi:hypothetical protein
VIRFLTADQVISIHEGVIQLNELQGMARNKLIEAVLGRIENRLAYGLIGDAFDLTASYACYIAVGHCFRYLKAVNCRVFFFQARVSSVRKYRRLLDQCSVQLNSPTAVCADVQALLNLERIVQVGIVDQALPAMFSMSCSS